MIFSPILSLSNLSVMNPGLNTVTDGIPTFMMALSAYPFVFGSKLHAVSFAPIDERSV
jgi:hypothetical protein